MMLNNYLTRNRQTGKKLGAFLGANSKEKRSIENANKKETFSKIVDEI